MIAPLNSAELSRWFAAEVLVHGEALRAWLKLKFPAVVDPDNLVQEALTRVWQAGGTQTVKSPKALLYTTAQNLALDQLRQRRIADIRTEAEISEFVASDDGPTPAEHTAHHQELELLTQAIQALPEKCRQVLTLRKIYGLSQKQIAAQLGISEHTVEAQVANGVRRCAAYLNRFGLP